MIASSIPFLRNHIPTVLNSTSSSPATHASEPPHCIRLLTLCPSHIQLFHSPVFQLPHPCISLSLFCHPQLLVSTELSHIASLHLNILDILPQAHLEAVSYKSQPRAPFTLCCVAFMRTYSLSSFLISLSCVFFMHA